ncbi:MAG: hypothetical protein ACPGVG_20575, partial [Mycobacterium sp.]
MSERVTDPMQAVEAWIAKYEQVRARNGELSATVESLRANGKELQAKLASMRGKRDALKVENARWRAAYQKLRDVIGEPDGPTVPAEPKDPDPPTEPEGKYGITDAQYTAWAHSLAGYGADAFKEARPPGWKDTRELSQPTTDLWRNWRIGEDVFLSDMAVRHFKDQKVLSNDVDAHGARSTAALVMRNVELREYQPGIKWLARLYHLASAEAVGCWVDGKLDHQGVPTYLEHAPLYGNVHGNSLLLRNFSRRIGGKGIRYIAHRPNHWQDYPPNSSTYDAPPLHRAEGNVAIDCDMSAARGSYSDTVFD